MKKIKFILLLSLLLLTFCVPLFGGMIISLVESGTSDYEDFTTYTEVDTGNRLTVTTYQVVADELPRDEDSYVYDDKGADHFSGDFTHQFEAQYSDADASSHITFWLLSNALDDYYHLLIDDEDFIAFRYYNGAMGVVVCEDGEYTTDTFTPSSGTTYFVTVERDDDYGTYGRMTAYVRTGSHTGTLVDTLIVDCGEQNDFQYIFGVQSSNSGGSGVYVDGFVRNLDLNESVGEGPYATYTVTEDGSGADYSAATFNALTSVDTSGGDVIFYFSGTFTTRIDNYQISGNGNGRVILDGYQAGSCDPITTECTSSAQLNQGMMIGDYTYGTGPDYITVRDFRMTRTNSTSACMTFYAPSGQSCDYILYENNYVHESYGTNFYINRSNYLVVKNNKHVHFGQGDTDAVQGNNFIAVDRALIEGNEFGHNETSYPSGCTSANTVEIHDSNYHIWAYNSIYGAPNQAGVATKETGDQYYHVWFGNRIHDNAQNGLYIGGGESDIRYQYAFCNALYNNGYSGGSSYDDADYTYWWSNLMISNDRYGFNTWTRDSGDPDYVYLWNNTIARNADADESDWGRSGTVWGLGSGSYRYTHNNIFWNNRPGGAGSHYWQQYFNSDQTLTSSDYNTIYHSSSTANYYYDSDVRSLSTMYSSYSLEEHSDVRDPLFTDPNGTDDTYGNEDDDYTLQSGSDEIGDGTDMSFGSPVQIDIGNSDAWLNSYLTGLYGVSSGVITLTGSECLDPDTDWTPDKLSASDVIITDWDTVGHINRGAYAD